MKSTLTTLAMLLAIVASADELKPIKYEVTTNYLKYSRIKDYNYATGSTNLIVAIQYETTNFPAAIVHAVTFGRGTNAVFVLKTQELLGMPHANDGWRNDDYRYYSPAAWVEAPK